MKTLEVKIDGEVVYSEVLYGMDAASAKLMHAKAWARNKAGKRYYEVYIKKEGVKSRSFMAGEIAERAIKLKASGKNMTQIAKILNFCPDTVQRFFKTIRNETNNNL